MDTAVKYQQQLLNQARQIYHHTPITDRTVQAYLATPRHLFVRRYRAYASKEWQHVSEANLQEHLATIYSDRPLTLFGEDDDNVQSTISQPSFVLRMLDLLQFQPGQTVFELGAGSGWNAALVGQLVEPHGQVYSLEIIPELAKGAAETITKLGIKNVHVVAGDGGEGYRSAAPYDRVIFTAGTYDLPRQFYDQVREGGLLLAVIKDEGGGDNLFILRRVGDHFESLCSMPCGFVQLTGRYKIDSMDPAVLEELPEWSELRHRQISRRPFWWGGKGSESFRWQTMGIRSFLGIAEPLFRTFKVPKSNNTMEQHYFGLWDRQHMSLVLAKDDELISYGSPIAEDCLLRHLHRWVDLGMPTAASFTLRAYRSDLPLAQRESQWLIKRAESQFLWSLDS